MRTSEIFICFCTVYIQSVLPAGFLKIPFIKPCHRNDPHYDKCVMEHAKYAVPYITQGDKKYHIASMAPLLLTKIELSNRGNLKIGFTDVRVYGLDDVVINDIKLDWKNQNVQLKLFFNKIVVLGKYTLDGKILLLSIHGDGDANVTAVTGDVDYGFNYTLKPKDGEHVAVVDKTIVKFDFKRFYFNFSNLFNGDKQLGETTNQVLNDNWKNVMDELGSAVEETISTIGASIVSGVLKYMSYDYLAPP